MKAEYYLLALTTFIVLLIVTFVAYPVILIVLGLLFGFFGILLNYGTFAGEFAISIATLPWDYWKIALPAVFLISVIYSFISKKIHQA